MTINSLKVDKDIYMQPAASGVNKQKLKLLDHDTRQKEIETMCYLCHESIHTANEQAKQLENLEKREERAKLCARVTAMGSMKKMFSRSTLRDLNLKIKKLDKELGDANHTDKPEEIQQKIAILRADIEFLKAAGEAYEATRAFIYTNPHTLTDEELTAAQRRIAQASKNAFNRRRAVIEECDKQLLTTKRDSPVAKELDLEKDHVRGLDDFLSRNISSWQKMQGPSARVKNVRTSIDRDLNRGYSITYENSDEPDAGSTRIEDGTTLEQVLVLKGITKEQRINIMDLCHQNAFFPLELAIKNRAKELRLKDDFTVQPMPGTNGAIHLTFQENGGILLTAVMPFKISNQTLYQEALLKGTPKDKAEELSLVDEGLARVEIAFASDDDYNPRLRSLVFRDEELRQDIVA